MGRRKPGLQLGVVADDLTGALDTGVQFARRGASTVVMLRDGPAPAAEVVVISTNSRALGPEEARGRAMWAGATLAGRLAYKKIDSTLRGNLGPELDGLMDALHLPRCLVAPAFPATGRTTVDGYHLVNGVPLAQTSFARDPLHPATESHLPTLLARQTARPVGHLPLQTVDAGAAEVAEALARQRASIVAADAATPAHLRTLAEALALLPEAWLACGSAGLASVWPSGWEPEVPSRGRSVGRGLVPRRPAGHDVAGPAGYGVPALPNRRSAGVPPVPGRAAGERWRGWPPDPRPALAIIGSRHGVNAAQLERASTEGRLRVVQVHPSEQREDEVVAAVSRLLLAGLDVAITTAFAGFEAGMEGATADLLGRICGRLVGDRLVCGVYLTGGDIARAACLSLGATGLRALGEVQAGVAASELAGGNHTGLRVVSKAGGFGDELALLQGIESLKGRTR